MTEWGFDGVIVTDWGALHDRVKAFDAGLDLEMPGSKGYFDGEVIAAVRDGALSEQRLDESVDRLLDLVLRAAQNRQPGFRCDAGAHHALAQKDRGKCRGPDEERSGPSPAQAGPEDRADRRAG